MNRLEAIAESLKGEFEGRVETGVSLARFTTYRLGGPAGLYVEPSTVDDLMALGRALSAEDRRPEILAMGRGSNLVVSDKGWPGIVLRPGPALSWLEGIESGKEERAPRLRAGAATSMPLLANWAARRGFTGLEFAIAIPGSVGGAVRMNAGAHGRETSDSLHSARVFDIEKLDVEERKASSFEFSYRKSNLTPNDFVVDATWALELESPDSVRERMEGYRKHRAATQPGAVQNAGSVFKNPSGDSAGRLVEAAGLKGLRVGGASVSTLHANFFIAEEGSTAQDVFDLVHLVRRRVAEKFGVELEPEIRFVGAYEEPADRSTAGVGGE